MSTPPIDCYSELLADAKADACSWLNKGEPEIAFICMSTHMTRMRGRINEYILAVGLSRVREAVKLSEDFGRLALHSPQLAEWIKGFR